MNDLVVVGAKALAGGVFVVLFALLSEAVKPKEFSGIFSAAPSVALASLTVTVLSGGAAKIPAYGRGMALGAAGLTICCVIATWSVRRWGARLGSVVAAPAWFLVTCVLLALVRGA